MKEIERNNPEYFTKSMTRMGNQEYRQLEGTLKAIENFETRKKPDVSKKRRKELFEEAKARIENYGSADYEMRKAIIYRENYLTMLQKSYSNVDGYEEAKAYVESFINPLDFYNAIKNTKSGDKLKDITYMYTNDKHQQVMNQFLQEVDSELEITESEFIEEGE